MPHLEPTYLRYIYDGLVKGSIHPENAAELPDGLIGLYEEAFDERTSVVERQKLLQRFAIWALLKKEVSAAFVAEVLGDTEDEIQNFISTYSAWFNSPESGKYQLYHERLKVYLLQKLSEGEVHKLTLKIFHRLKIHFDSTLGNECEEYAQYYFLDYYNIVVNLSENLKINSELHQDYFIRVKKDPIRLFYLENGRNHRERHLRQATSYFSRKKDLKVLDQIVHLINRFQNKRSAPVELSKLIWSDNRNDQLYGYNLCSRQEEKLFLLVYSSIYHKELTFSEWHLEVIKEYWKELQPTKKIYDLPSFFLLDLVPFLVDLALFKLEEIDVKKIDFRLIHSLFDYTSFELFEIQRYDEEVFSAFSTASIDLLFQDEIKYRLNNEDYFSRIDLLSKIRDLNDLKFLIDTQLYFDLPSNFELVKTDENSLLARISKSQFSEIYYNKTNDFFSFPLNGNGRNLIISNCLSYIRDGKYNVVIDYLKYLKRDIKFGYTRDSDGATHPADDSWQYNEMIFSIFNFCLFREVLSIQELEEFLFLVIKDDNWNPKYFNALYSFKCIISNPILSIQEDLKKLIITERVKRVSCNYYYLHKNKYESLDLFSKFLQLNSNNDQNINFYEISFANCFSQINLDESILFDYYRNTNDIRSSVLPAIDYGIRKGILALIWNFAHINQSEMQKFGPSRSYSWYAITELISIKNNNFYSIYQNFLIPFLKSVDKFSDRFERNTSIVTNFIEPVESADLMELLNSLRKYTSRYISIYETLLFDNESYNQENIINLTLLKNGYLSVFDSMWNKSDFKKELKIDLIKCCNESNFILDYYHNLYLLKHFFDHPEYIKSIAVYSKLYKKYKVKPKPLSIKTRFISNKLIEQLQCKDNIVPLEVSPSNLMYSNFILGQGYFEIEDYKNAIKFFKTAILNRKAHSGVNSGNCFLELGKSYYYVNNFGKAIENLNFARIEITKSKDNLNDLSDCYYFLGLSYEENKKWNDSISNYIKCKNIDNRKLEKDHKDHLTVLKSILRISKHFDEKYHIKYINALITNLKSDSQLNNHEIGYYYLTLARKYRENEDFNSELKSLRKCVKHLNSSNYRTNESRIKIYFLLAKSYEKNMHFLRALKTVKNIENEIANIFAENDINSMIARCAYKAKKFKLSLEYYLKIDNDDSNSLITFKIAYCHEQISSVNKAFHYYLNYLEKKSEDDMFLNLFKELGDEDFIDFSEDELIKALDFIESHSSKKSKIDNWIQKLIELKNANN